MENEPARRTLKVTKKTAERIASALPKFQKVLAIAKDRDLNESDTVSIITDMLSEVFGYDKYLEVTSELAIRGTYCDIAVKLDGKYQFLVECKAVGTELKEQHLRQAVGYGANKGVQWIILTNGADWQVNAVRRFESCGLSRVDALREMVAAYAANMHTNEPVHTWALPE